MAGKLRQYLVRTGGDLYNRVGEGGSYEDALGKWFSGPLPLDEEAEEEGRMFTCHYLASGRVNSSPDPVEPVLAGRLSFWLFLACTENLGDLF